MQQNKKKSTDKNSKSKKNLRKKRKKGKNKTHTHACTHTHTQTHTPYKQTQKFILSAGGQKSEMKVFTGLCLQRPKGKGQNHSLSSVVLVIPGNPWFIDM